MTLLFIEWDSELEAKLEEFGGWGLRRDPANKSWVLLCVENPDLLAYCKEQPSCEVVPHLSTSVGRMSAGLSTLLAEYIQQDAATVADVLQDMGIRLD